MKFDLYHAENTMMLLLVIALPILLIAVWIILLWHHRYTLSSLWREPVLRHPVLIIESDDWGPGPKAHGQQLHRIAQALTRHHDTRGHPAVMTLGIALALPDVGRMKQDNYQQYYRRLLSPALCPAIFDVMRRGVASGVFTLQLHGLEHYWPPVLLWAIKADPVIKDWLLSDEFPRTEELPSAMQSRWTNTMRLPSRAIPEAEIKAAAALEVKIFSRIFKVIPEVAVPPTFLWNNVVEEAWAAAGVRVIVTPGHRCEARERDGSMMAKGRSIHNGQINAYGQVYVVRDEYFEPAFGHLAEKGLAALKNKSKLGRPALLETHRSNFVDDPDVAEAAINELERLLAEATKRFTTLLFMSTAELARAFVAVDREMLELRFMPRLHVYLLRLREVPGFWKLAWLSGAIIPAGLLYMISRPFYKYPGYKYPVVA